MPDAPDNFPDLTGTKIGEYEIVSRLGVGGMGIVYEGRQPLIGKRVAVKVLLPQLSADRELVERFISEARAVNEIRHRGIVDIFSFGQLPTGQHYFVMEYLDGQPFDRLIKTRAPISASEALWWTEEVCEALFAAHEAGIIHRDIKPSNLFLVDTGRGRPYVKLLDFGIAKLGAIKGEASPQTRVDVVVGTPDYMSPEQARGLPISPQTDIYALGCVLYELLTGKRTFKGENPQQTMFMHVERPAPKLSEQMPGLPIELDDLLLWTMEKDPAVRPHSAEELGAHIKEIRATLPEMLPRPSPSRRDGSSPGTYASSTPFPPPSGPRRSLSGSTPVAATPRTTTGPRKTLTGENPPTAAPRPPPIEVDLALTGEAKRVPSSVNPEASTRVGTPVLLQPVLTAEVVPASAPMPELESTPEPMPQLDPTPEPLAAPVEVRMPTQLAAPRPVPVPAPRPLPAPVSGPEAAEESGGLASKLPMVLVLLAIAALGAYGVLRWQMAAREEVKPDGVVEEIAPPVVREPPVAAVVKAPEEPAKVPEPVKTPEPVKPPVRPGVGAKAPVAVATGKKPEKKLVVGGVSQDTLMARIEKLEKKLAEKEAKSGNADRELRHLLTQARGLQEQADSEGRIKSTSKYLDDIQKQLDKSQ